MTRDEGESSGSVICVSERDVGHASRRLGTLKSIRDAGSSEAEKQSSPVNNWIILSFLWLYDFLLCHVARCCGWRRQTRWLPFPCPQTSWLSAEDGKEQHCYFNQTASDMSLATAGTSSAAFLPETCLNAWDLESFFNDIDSLQPPQTYLLDHIRCDRIVSTRPDEDRRRRTIIIERQKESFGFTLQVTTDPTPSYGVRIHVPCLLSSIQTYGIRHKEEDEVELLTYVDRVDPSGPAYKGNRIGS